MPREFIKTEDALVCKLDLIRGETVLSVTKDTYAGCVGQYGKEQARTMVRNMFHIPITSIYGESPLTTMEEKMIEEYFNG